MENLYEKLRNMSEEHFNTLQIVVGLLAGVLCWFALRAGSLAEDQMISWVLIAVFLVVILGSRTLARKIERPIKKFSLCMAIGLGVCIAIFALCAFVLPIKSGLFELIFDIKT